MRYKLFLICIVSLILFSSYPLQLTSTSVKAYYAKEYDDLTKTQKKEADEIMKLVKKGSKSSATYVSHLNFDQAITVLTAIEHTYFPYNDYRSFQMSKPESKTVIISFNPKEMKKQYENEEKYKKIAKNWMKCVTAKNKKEKATQIFKCIAKKAEYKKGYEKPYQILKNGKGVCNGYAIIAKEMLQLANIDARYCYGFYDGQYHSWVTYTLNSQRYYTDPTYYDATKDNSFIHMKTLKKQYKIDSVQTSFCYSYYHTLP